MTRSSTLPSLRAWQKQALATYLAQQPRDFLAVATPGAGKTTFALRIAAELLARGEVTAITVVAPTEHLKTQWARAAAQVGIHLDPGFRNSDIHTARGFHGVVITYAQVGLAANVHRRRTITKPTLVILDEIHHAGDAKTWGDGVKVAFEPATRRLALTGTPFRSDDNPIPFIRYEPDRDGVLRSKADLNYGYREALSDAVVRPVLFLAYSGQATWRTSAGDELTARLGDPLTADLAAQAWRTALAPEGDWIQAVLRAADARLSIIRAQGMPDAGGLVIASDHISARAYARHITSITGIRPVVVLSDDTGASGKISEFATSSDRWMVAVRMVSEGVDIPRLAVGVYATSVNTPLFFAQAIGRFIRARKAGETATVFVPSVPSLLQLASELEQERDHVLGQPHRSDELDDQLLAAANRQNDERTDQQLSFTALAASAHLDQVIFDGTAFGTPAEVGTTDEENYLGLPGLLNPDQVATLLAQHQAQRERQSTMRHSSAVPVAVAEPELSTFEQRAALRRKLNGLVASYHRRSGRPHGQIHADIRRKCGGPPSAQASVDQLRERIALIHDW